MQNLVEHLFVGPMWPASLLALFCSCYVLLSFLGGLDLGLDSDVDLDVDMSPDVDLSPDLDVAPDVDVSTDAGGHDLDSDLLGGAGAATLRALHLDRVPVLVWLAIFALFFWLTSFLLWFEFDSKKYPATWFPSVLLAIRNGVIAVVITKFATKPIHNLLVPPVQYTPGKIVGGTGVVETHQADGDFGRAKFFTNAAPLLLNIRTDGEVIEKGETVDILDYDSATNRYRVAATWKPSGQ